MLPPFRAVSVAFGAPKELAATKGLLPGLLAPVGDDAGGLGAMSSVSRQSCTPITKSSPARLVEVYFPLMDVAEEVNDFVVVRLGILESVFA